MTEFSFINLLNTEYKLKLREWRNQDFVRINMTNQEIISEQEHEKYLESLEKDDSREVYVAFKNGNPFAVLTFFINNEENYVEPGMYIINEDDLGKGYGMVLSYARLEYTFEKMPNGVLRTIILKSNERNRKLQIKYGGVITDSIILKDNTGTGREANVIVITKDKWQERKESIEKEIKKRVGENVIGRIPIS